MVSAWSGTLGELKQLENDGKLVSTITDGFITAYSTIREAEQRSWKNSIPALLKVLSNPDFDTIYVLIEMQMPVGSERADIILLGGQPLDRCIYIIELKQWSHWEIDEKMEEVVVPVIGPQQYPNHQVLNYAGKLQLFHPLATHFHLKAAAFLHNLSLRDKNALEYVSSEYLKENARLFCYDDRAVLADEIKQHLLPCKMSKAECVAFGNAIYKQTDHLFDLFTRNMPDLEKDAMAVLGRSGLGLTIEQRNLAMEILNSVDHGEERVFAIEGDPGSGKTLLAFTILLRALQRLFLGQKNSAALALRSNRLKAILNQCFERYPGASGVIMFFGSSEEDLESPNSRGKRISGIADPTFLGSFRLIVCDEAQRLRKENIEIVLKRAPTCVLFFDSGQRLNPPESGNKEEFARVSSRIGKTFRYERLEGVVRCQGGPRYIEWIERLLKSPEEREVIASLTTLWSSNYEFNVYSSAEAMIRHLEMLRDTQHNQQVALVASFTESKGVLGKENRDDDRNIRIGRKVARASWPLYRETNLCIRWLMEPTDYVKFWLEKGSNPVLGSNLLNRVASIYGTQGVESDYVGIFWGRDLVIRNGKWELAAVEPCHDSIDGLVINDWRAGIKEWAQPLEETIELLKNRYRIFLTRGIKGTFIFCEDEETRGYFLDMKRLKQRISKIG